VIVAEHKMSIYSAISWKEQVCDDDDDTRFEMDQNSLDTVS